MKIPYSIHYHWLFIFPSDEQHPVLYCHLQHHNDTIIKQTQEDFFINILYLSLYCKVRKGYSRFACEQNWTEIFWPPLLWPSTLCLSRSPDGQPEALGSTLLGAGFLYCILSATSLVPKLHQGSRGPPSAGCSFPYHISSITPSPTGWNSNSTVTGFTSELYNSSTSTRSPTRSLKSHAWSSSSENNCHAVQRSLSSGASVYECTLGFFSLSHFVSQFPPTRFPLLTAIGMCHFLPVHHLEWHFGPGRRSKYNTCMSCPSKSIWAETTHFFTMTASLSMEYCSHSPSFIGPSRHSNRSRHCWNASSIV